jgi:acyl-coenzyme A thioesterase PaaI-like protein
MARLPHQAVSQALGFPCAGGAVDRLRGVNMTAVSSHEQGVTSSDLFDHRDLGDGWTAWNLRDETRFNNFIQPLMVRVEEPTADGRPRARVRMVTQRKHSNLGDNVHGAVILALMDVALFGSMRALGSIDGAQSVTLDLSSQFVGAGRVGEPMDAIVELVRETGRLIFLRGLVVQGAADDHIVASFSGTVRKINEKR